MREHYVEQTRLLMSIIPEIATINAFALKGGTAINLFYRDMPRISVDIDLAYLPMGDRANALKAINEIFDRIIHAIKSTDFRLQIQRAAVASNAETRVLVNNGKVQVKIETSPVMRGTVCPPRIMNTSGSVADMFGHIEMNVVAFEDLYGGKLHAALDRQHPRGFFDIKVLYENEGITDELFHVFLVYVASSRRPMHELLKPGDVVMDKQYFMEFSGMTNVKVNVNSLIETRRKLHIDIENRLTGHVADFLLSVHNAKPNFKLIDHGKALDLPAVQWKLLNLRKLKSQNPRKHALQREALENIFH